MRVGRLGRRTRWLAGIAGFGVAAGAVAVAQPADASTTVAAELALTGIVTGTSPIGGSSVGIHPGDSVDLTAGSAGLSTQGLNNLGIPVGDVVGSVAGRLVGYQVVVHLPATFPGGVRDVTLGPCGGRSDLKVGFPDPGTYNFTWSAYSVTAPPLLGCRVDALTVDGNQLSQAGIALNAGNQWVGKIIVATNPPGGTGEAGVMPNGCCDEVSGHNPDAGPDSVLLNGLGGGTGAVPHIGGAGADATPVPTRGGQPADLAARTPAAGVPVVLAILAIVVLSLVTATYARLYLTRRKAG
jgi:hypothetical protein